PVGIQTVEDAGKMRGKDIHGFPCGGTFMRAPSPGDKFRELFACYAQQSASARPAGADGTAQAQGAFATARRGRQFTEGPEGHLPLGGGIPAGSLRAGAVDTIRVVAG